MAGVAERIDRLGDVADDFDDAGFAAVSARSSPSSSEIIMQHTGDHNSGRVDRSSSVGLITRQKEPKNLETPIGRLDSFLTPTELFYIRSHFPTPRLDVASYRLEIDGAVRHPLSISYDECAECPPRRGSPHWNARATAGSFSFLRSRGPSGNSAPSATRSGPESLSPTCSSEPAWAKTRARSSSKAPTGERRRSRPSPRIPSLTRGLPREKAMRREVLIAYQMNGRDLTRDHGYPVRAIVPGHYGMAVRQMADADPGRAGAVSRLLADIGLWVLGRRRGSPFDALWGRCR